MDVNPTSNYLTNSVAAAQRFAGQVMSKIQEGIERKPWGQYKSAYGPVRETVTQAISDPAKAVAAATLDALTNETRKDVWHYTNMHRMIGDVGQYVGPRLGLDSTLAGAVVAAGVPVVLSTLSGQTGPITQGLRPAGYKAVAPVSKEKDPTGRTPQSPVLEATMRYAMGQKSQLLPYQDFKQERPDVAPSTYSQYRRYERMKPEAGSLVIVDPESQSFSALGGTIRGTARGLNDPEIRLKGVPVTASAALGTAAGLGTIKALSQAVNQPLATGPIPSVEYQNKTLLEKITTAPTEELKQAATRQYQKFNEQTQTLAKQQQILRSKISTETSPEIKTNLQREHQLLNEDIKKVVRTFSAGEQPLGTKIGMFLGDYRDPALLAAGLVTAGAVAAGAKKLFERAADRRIKKESPVEYLKHKHGSLEQASAALGQPQAQSWQQLTPYIK